MMEPLDISVLNYGYLLDLYDRFLRDPNSVDASSREFLNQWLKASPAAAPQPSGPGQDISKIIGAVNLAQAVRVYGHLAAKLDPLGQAPPGDPALDPGRYGLDVDDLRRIPGAVVGGPVGQRYPDAYSAIQELRKTYCSRIGYEFGHIHVPEEREWLRQAAERGEHRDSNEAFNDVSLLKRLTQIEAFEQFLHRIFPGKTRFSIEGLDILVPMLDELVSASADAGICMIMLGMAHRGRLNVLAHILSKPYAQILAEFKDPVRKYLQFEEVGWTGDVKYHTGANHAVVGDETIKLVISMAPNPSHLEHINPVITGMARAADSGIDRPGRPKFFPKASLPILIHGDASFPGEGIVAETLNLSRLPGYQVAGTIHIIANNQLGFTATPLEGRSTLYASDLAKGFEIPILHVNADDPLACLEAARMAFAYRDQFGKDFLIDLIGYRRYGHNEGDEPGFTQPVLYQEIESHPSVRRIWADELIQAKKVDPSVPDQLMQGQMDELQEALNNLKPEEDMVPPVPDIIQNNPMEDVDTRVSIDTLRQINAALLDLPEDFHLHRKIERAMQRRRKALDDPDAQTIEWATAEELAFATILGEGIPVRMTGQDVERGTFSQRHAVFFDVENDQPYTPLQAFPQAKASFEIHNSPLSENAALAFEYGYSIQQPKCLVIWEAQYGDFINAAQTIVDEFITSSRAKWGQNPSLTLFLPHGFEGQGPDHSSGRIERFLQLSNETNLRIANCTTAAQVFHLLRLQAKLLKTQPVPLILFTPKSLLRHPLVASTSRELAEGQWQAVIDDPEASQHRKDVKRLLICSGKVAIDLIESEHRQESRDVAILRLEQLSPFPAEPLRDMIERYPGLHEVCWVQEEPENMGAWSFIKERNESVLGGRIPLRYVGRPISASPSEGSFNWHVKNQAALVAQAYQKEIDKKDRVEISRERVDNKD